jgi:hypothetical protein
LRSLTPQFIEFQLFISYIFLSHTFVTSTLHCILHYNDQVYKAKLTPQYGGGEVAVKCQRPGVLETVGLDLYLMRSAAQKLRELRPDLLQSDWANILDTW